MSNRLICVYVVYIFFIFIFIHLSQDNTNNMVLLQMGDVNNTHFRIHQRHSNLQIFRGERANGQSVVYFEPLTMIFLGYKKKRCRGGSVE